MNSLVSYFGCGKVYIRSNKVAVDYVVTKIEDLTDKILPFFDLYKIAGEKTKDLDNFKQIAQLIKSKAHLTSEGLDQIRKIKAGMNKGRKT
jgi:hypothetical protein